MPSPIAAVDLIKRAMRKNGVFASGEEPGSDEINDGLDCLNDVLERWSIQSLAVYGSLPEVFATVAGQSTYTIGVGGDFSTDRPPMIVGITTTVDGVDYPAAEWSMGQYQAVGLKTQRQPIVERWVFVNDAPLAQIILWPTPSRATPISIDAPRILTQVPDINTLLILPPGYVEALQYAVAQSYGDEFGAPIDVTAKARSSLALIKRANRTSRTMSFDAPLVPAGGAGASIYGW